MDSPAKKVNVLSFDGGGSRGVMEIKLLQHTMQAYSAMMENPEQISDLLKEDIRIEKSETRDKLRHICKHVIHEIHPTEVFDFIVGTSVGAIISFLLVGGGQDPNTGERIPLSVEDTVELSCGAVPKIFKKKKSKSLLESFAKGIDNRKKLFTKFVPYSQDYLEEMCNEIFGNAMSHEITYNGCIAGAVARQFNEDVNLPDVLEIFDSKSEVSHLVKEIILGSTDAPTFFETPRKIGLQNYIDGGVAGNCPLVVALPRVEKIFGPNASIDTVLSIATPDPNEKRLDNFKYAWQKSIFFIKYLSTQLTYGSPIFAESQKNYKNALFIRATHSSEAATKFMLDETDVKAMLEVCEHEFKHLPSYSQLILDSAAVIAARTLQKPSDMHIEMLQELAQSMAERGKTLNARYVCKTVLGELNSLEDYEGVYNHAKMNFYWILGHCDDKMNHYEEAYANFYRAYDFATELQEVALQARLMSNLGTVTRELGKLSESKEWHEKSLKILKTVKADSSEIAQALNSLGNCLRDLGELDDALNCYQIAKDKLEESPNDAVALGWVLNNMGICLKHMKQYKEAKECFEASLKTKKMTLGPDECNDGIAMTLSNMAGVFIGLGELEQAKIKFEEVLSMKRSIYGQNAENTSLASTLHNLGNVCFRMGDFSTAQVYLNQALSMRKKFLGSNHVDVAKTLKVLGLANHGLCDFVKAKQYLMSALEIASSAQGNPGFILKLKEDLQSLIGESQGSLNKVIELKRKESTTTQVFDLMDSDGSNVNSKLY